jgi:predicted nucleotidyltransferase
MSDREEIKKVVYDIAQEFKLNIEKIILFDSRAKGNYTKLSD